MPNGVNHRVQQRLKKSLALAISREEIELAQSYRDHLQTEAIGDSRLSVLLQRRGNNAQKKLEKLRILLAKFESRLEVTSQDIKLARQLTTRWRRPAKTVVPKERKSQEPISKFYEKSIPGDHSVSGGLIRSR
jgi:hypothetical protein